MRFKNSQTNLRTGQALTVFLMLQIGLTGCAGKVDPTQNQVAEPLVKVDQLYDAGALPQPTTPVKGNEAILEAKTVLEPDTNLKPEAALEPKALIKKLRTPVNDFTQTLTADETAALDKKITEIYEEGLLQIGVIIVPTTGDISTLDYAMTLAKGWQLGSPKNNNGLLILVAKRDKSLHILTGLDAEKLLPDEQVRAVINSDITPFFSKGDYAAGLLAGIEALSQDVRSRTKN